MPTTSRTRHDAKERATRGAGGRAQDVVAARFAERASARSADIPDATFGKQPRDLARAVRRSTDPTGMVTTGARGSGRGATTRRISKHAASKRRARYADAIDQLAGCQHR